MFLREAVPRASPPLRRRRFRRQVHAQRARRAGTANDPVRPTTNGTPARCCQRLSCRSVRRRRAGLSASETCMGSR